MVMRGSCTSFAMLDGASKDRNPKLNNDLCRKGSGKYISTARRLASRGGIGSGGSKASDNLRLATLARQADVFLLPPPPVLRLKILLYSVHIFDIIAQSHAWMISTGGRIAKLQWLRAYRTELYCI